MNKAWLCKSPVGLIALTGVVLMIGCVVFAVSSSSHSEQRAIAASTEATESLHHNVRENREQLNAETNGNDWRHEMSPINIDKSETFRLTGNTTEIGWTQIADNVTVHRGFENNPHNYTYILNSPELCRDFDSKRLKVLIFVETSVAYTERRKGIRKTWAQRSLQKAMNFRVVFLFANSTNQSVNEAALREHYTYGDVCQENFEELFDNLSIKSVMGLKYAVTFCRNADYVVKVDDDIYLHVPNLLKALNRHGRTPFKDHLLCHRNRVKKILRPGKSELELRTKTLKYEVSHEKLPGERFPPYCSGFSYSMSLLAARKLYLTSLGTPLFFIEDVYITGFCRDKAGMQLVDHQGMTLRPPVTEHNAPCNFLFTERITSNEIGPQEMLDIWDGVNTQGFFCPR